VPEPKVALVQRHHDAAYAGMLREAARWREWAARQPGLTRLFTDALQHHKYLDATVLSYLVLGEGSIFSDARPGMERAEVATTPEALAAGQALRDPATRWTLLADWWVADEAFCEWEQRPVLRELARFNFDRLEYEPPAEEAAEDS
jgi:hypothetical protein